MNRVVKILTALGIFLFSFSTAYALFNNDHPRTFLGPMLRGTYTDTMNDWTGYSIAGEAGFRNYRAGLTVGFIINENQRIKLTGEYLLQKITYPFFVGNTSEWVKQAAIGADYIYDILGMDYNPQFILDAYLSHAPSKSLSTQTGTFINSVGLPINFVDQRRIAGSDAQGISPGVSAFPWTGGKVELNLNYDRVIYDKKFAPSEDAIGFGGTARYNQIIMQDVELALVAAVRKPFNNYQASVNWINVPYYGIWTVGVDAAYTAGKNTLPSTYNVGLTANYFVDQRVAAAPPRTMIRNFLGWVSQPAVYLPQVLAIPDESVSFTSCAGVALVGVIPDITVDPGDTVSFSIAGFFAPPAGLAYAIAVTPAPAAGSSVTIDPATGVVTITNGGTIDQTLTATVSASTDCATATATFTITLPEDEGG